MEILGSESPRFRGTPPVSDANDATRAQLAPLLAELTRRRPAGRCGLFAFTGIHRGDGVTFVARLAARELARKNRTESLVISVDQLGRLPDQPGDTFEEISPGVWAPFRQSSGAAISPEVLLRRISDLKNWPGGMVLIDCPPVSESQPANSVFSRVDGTVVVVAAGETTRQDLAQAGARLKRANAKVLGMILNKRKYAIPPSVRRYF